MRDHYLAARNGIQAHIVHRIFQTPEGGWVIKLREPLEACCPVCGTRSRWRKRTGFHRLQGVGAPGISVEIRAML